MAGMAARASTASSAASNINFLIFFSFSLSLSLVFSLPDSILIGQGIHRSAVRRPVLDFSLGPRTVSAGVRGPAAHSRGVLWLDRGSGPARRAPGGLFGRGDYPGRSRGTGRAELGFSNSHETK